MSASVMPFVPRDPNAPPPEPPVYDATPRGRTLLPVALRRSKVTEVRISEDYLLIRTDAGDLGFAVEGDCCSVSYFHDAVGVNKLIGSLIISISQGEGVDLDVEGKHQESVQHYGLTVVSEHPKWGDVTTVFSFRNESNGYYGGSVETVDLAPHAIEAMTPISNDWTVD